MVILVGVAQLSFSEEPISHITKKMLPLQEDAAPDTGKPDAEFRIKVDQTNGKIPDLTIPTYSYGMKTRIVDTRLSKDRIEVAVQNDELSIDYLDYNLVDGKWVVKSQKSVSALNGPRALALAQVDILEGGIVEVKYSNGFIGSSQTGWDNALISKIHKHDENMQTERYVQEGGNFILVGKPFNPDLRFKTNIPKQNVEKSPETDGLDGSEQQVQQQSNSPISLPPTAQLPSTKNVPQAKQTSPTPNNNFASSTSTKSTLIEESPSSMRRSVVVVVIVAALGLLWVLLKKRK